MLVSAGFPLVLCATAAILFTVVSVSAPSWDKIFFLNAASANATIHFGVFGSTGTHPTVGYRFNSTSLHFNDDTLHTPVFLNLTRTLILHPIGNPAGKLHESYSRTFIAAAISGGAFLCGLCGVCGIPAGTAFMALLAALGTLVSLMAFLFDMVLFGIARRQFHQQGFSSQYGNACWLTLGALVAILLGFFFASSTIFSKYCNKRRNKPIGI